MSCLKVSIRNATGTNIIPGVNVLPGINTSVRIAPKINITITKLKEQPIPIINHYTGLIVKCYITCAVQNTPYLDVAPNIIWLTPDMLDSANFEIMTNLTWEIN